jgi:hypothetical protein
MHQELQNTGSWRAQGADLLAQGKEKDTADAG